MFQFRAFPPYTYLIQCTVLEYCSSVLPHSEISGSTLICSSPKLIAACHVLLRLLMPRHSPCALISFTSKRSPVFWFSELCRSQQKLFTQNCIYPFKKFHNCCFKVQRFRAAPSVALLLFFSSVQFSRCMLRGVPSKLNNARGAVTSLPEGLT